MKQGGIKPTMPAKELGAEHLPAQDNAHEQARIATIYTAIGSMAYIGVSMMALLKGETGHQIVVQTLANNPGECFAHVFNCCYAGRAALANERTSG